MDDVSWPSRSPPLTWEARIELSGPKRSGWIKANWSITRQLGTRLDYIWINESMNMYQRTINASSKPLNVQLTYWCEYSETGAILVLCGFQVAMFEVYFEVYFASRGMDSCSSNRVVVVKANRTTEKIVRMSQHRSRQMTRQLGVKRLLCACSVSRRSWSYSSFMLLNIHLSSIHLIHHIQRAPCI